MLGALPALAALRDPALASYHAVEHKAIGGYEQGRDPEEVPKEHERCGSNLIGPMLAFSIAGQLVTERLVEDPGPMTRAVAALAGVGGAVEMFAFAERNPDSAIGRAVHGPGYEIQRLVSTREPTAGAARGRGGRAERNPTGWSVLLPIPSRRGQARLRPWQQALF